MMIEYNYVKQELTIHFVLKNQMYQMKFEMIKIQRPLEWALCQTLQCIHCG